MEWNGTPKKPRDYLRKVVSSEQMLMSVDMSKRGDTMSVTNHYKRLLRLECGHIQWRPDSAKVPLRAICKKCWDLQLLTASNA